MGDGLFSISSKESYLRGPEKPSGKLRKKQLELMGHGALRSERSENCRNLCSESGITLLEVIASLMASKAIFSKEGGLVLGFANTVTYFDEMFQKCCSLHSAEAFGRAHVESSWPRAALSPE